MSITQQNITYVLITTLTISTTGIVAIQEYEGTRNHAYLDSVGVPTICTGSTRGVKLGDYKSDSQCAELLMDDISKEGKILNSSVKVPVSQQQYDAMLSFTFNIGSGNFSKSTFLKKLNAGDYCGAANELPKWSYAGGKKLKGLETRRYSERDMFINGTIGGCS